VQFEFALFISAYQSNISAVELVEMAATDIVAVIGENSPSDNVLWQCMFAL